MKIQFGRRFWIVATAVIVVFTVFVVGRNDLHAVKIKRQINQRLKIDGILLTMVDNRTNNAKAIISSLRSTVGENIRVFRSEIPFSVRAAECSLSGESIFSHDSNGKVAAAYEALTKEVTEIEERAKNRSGPDRVR